MGNVLAATDKRAARRRQGPVSQLMPDSRDRVGWLGAAHAAAVGVSGAGGRGLDVAVRVEFGHDVEDLAIDHVLIGLPGVVTVNTKHYRAERLKLDGDDLVVNGRPTEYVCKARLEALRAEEAVVGRGVRGGERRGAGTWSS